MPSIQSAGRDFPDFELFFFPKTKPVVSKTGTKAPIKSVSKEASKKIAMKEKVVSKKETLKTKEKTSKEAKEIKLKEKEIKTKEEYKVKKIAEFKLIYQENIERIVIALALSGYFVRVSKIDEFRLVEVFTF